MARYVDGYILPVPKKKLNAYRRLAQKAGKIWREHGALDYKECAGDDLNIKMGVPSPAPDEGPARRDDRIRLHSLQVACASGQRQRQGIMKDPRIANMGDPKDMPFNHKRMVYGGFKVLVDV